MAPSKKRLLVVEDDRDIRESLQAFLEWEGYGVQTAEHGKDALSLLADPSRRPHLILLDLMMPVMNGWEFKEQLEQDPVLDQIPVIVVTAFSERAQSMKRLSGVLSKPLDLDLLTNSLKRYFEKELVE